MTRPADAVRSAVRRALLAEPTIDQGVLVACSGGPDSLALAAAARQAARAARWRVGAVVVDHQLQVNSAAVADRAAEQCRALGLDPVLVARVEVGTGGGPEAAARRARYTALASAARSTGAAAVLLGHTLDDQAETVLLGLARGAGARSLAGMPARAPLSGADHAVLLRPLLGLSRQQLIAACQQWGLDPWQDPHNADPAFTRVRVRNSAMPALVAALGPGVPQALARTAELLRDDDQALSGMAEQVLIAVADRDAAGSRLDCAALAPHPAAIRRRVLHRVLIEAGAPAARVTAAHLFRLDALVRAGAATDQIKLPGGLLAHLRCGTLEVVGRQE